MTMLRRNTAEGGYDVYDEAGERIGRVWKDSGWRDRYTRWGTKNTVHPHYVAVWWRATGTTEEFDTRNDAVWALTTERKLRHQSDN